MATNDLAGDETIGTSTPLQVYSSDTPVVTESGILDTGDLAKYTVLGRLTATGKLVAFDSTAATGAENAVAILAQPADATAGDVEVPIFTGGTFNADALVWDAPTNTLALRQAAFRATTGHMIFIRDLYPNSN